MLYRLKPTPTDCTTFGIPLKNEMQLPPALEHLIPPAPFPTLFVASGRSLEPIENTGGQIRFVNSVKRINIWTTRMNESSKSPLRRCLTICLFLASGILFSNDAAGLTNLNLRLVSNVKPSANPLSYGDVWAENDLACLGVWLNYSTYNYGVGIYSISNPAVPQLLGIYSPSPIGQNQFELGAVRNKIGYFGSWGGGGLHIVSLTNPATPTLLCRIGATTGNVTNGF